MEINVKNLEYVAGQFERIGLGALVPKLAKAMSSGAQHLAIEGMTEVGKGKADVRAVLNKSEKDDFYFFNSYTVAYWEKDGDDKKKAVVFVNNKHNFTLDQVVKMLKGGAVESLHLDRDKQEYTGWSVFEKGHTDDQGYPKPKTYHEHFGYDLRVAISQMRFDELKDPVATEKLLSELRSGEIARVHVDGVAYYVVPNVMFKSMKVFDENMEPLTKEERLSLMQPEARAHLEARQEENRNQREAQKNGAAKRA